MCQRSHFSSLSWDFNHFAFKDALIYFANLRLIYEKTRICIFSRRKKLTIISSSGMCARALYLEIFTGCPLVFNFMQRSGSQPTQSTGYFSRWYAKNKTRFMALYMGMLKKKVWNPFCKAIVKEKEIKHLRWFLPFSLLRIDYSFQWFCCLNNAKMVNNQTFFCLCWY